MPKIAFYYAHQEDMGHAVHLLRLINELKRRGLRKNEIFVFQAGKRQRILESRRDITLIQIPLPFYSKKNLRVPVEVSAEDSRERAGFLISRLSAIKPDVFVTEFFPFGRLACGAELSLALSYLKREGAKIYASVPAPYFSHPAEAVGELFDFCRYYDRLLIHTPVSPDLDLMAKYIPLEKRISRGQFLRVFEKLSPKIKFTGYMMDKTAPATSRKKLIIFTRGAGTTSFNLLACGIRARKLVDSSYKFLVVCGPATDGKELARLRRLARGEKAVIVKKEEPHLVRLLARAAVCVSSGGQTVYELLRLGTKAVISPFSGYPGHERADQTARAALLKNLAGASVLDENSLSPEKLAREINKQLAAPKPQAAPAKLFYGAEISADILLEGI